MALHQRSAIVYDLIRSPGPSFVPSSDSFRRFVLPRRRHVTDIHKIRAVASSDENAKPTALQNGKWLKKELSWSIKEVEFDPLHDNSNLRFMTTTGVYAAMAIGWQAICYMTGSDQLGGFSISPDAIIQGFGFSLLPSLAMWIMQHDHVVKVSAPAKAVRDAEDEDLKSFINDMSLWQLMLVVAMDAVVEELLFRVSIQGALANFLLNEQRLSKACDGVAVLTGCYPFFAPFAHTLAAVLTASLIGSVMFFSSSSPDSSYVICPSKVSFSSSSYQELRKNLEASFERQNLKKIYSPLVDSLLSLYLGFEWIQTGNILIPIITHMLYSTMVMVNGLQRLRCEKRT